MKHIRPRKGTRFGSLVTTGRFRRGKWGTEAKAMCSHGTKKFVVLSHLKTGNTSSCQGWNECRPKKGTKFGKLTTTGRFRLRRGKYSKTLAEVICLHGTKKFVHLNGLKTGNTSSCRVWDECRPKKGTKFGKLTTTGRFRRGKSSKTSAEVICSHGTKKFVNLNSLKRGGTSSCRVWDECRPKKGTKFGKLTTTGRFRRGKSSKTSAEVICPCGNKKFITLGDLKTGHASSCRQWEECRPKKGTKFGKLTTTGRFRKGERTLAEVICSHGNKKFVHLDGLKRGNASSCRQWEECRPKKGTKFGKLTTTGRFRRGRRTSVEVICSHGNKKFVRFDDLKMGRASSCRNWDECGLTKGEENHYRYLRNHTPNVDVRQLSRWQHSICVLCGKKGRLNSVEHLLPLARVARWKMSLRRKQEIANHLFSLFAAHRGCNSSRWMRSLGEWWAAHPGAEFGGRQAFANLMWHHKPHTTEEMRLVKRLLREVGLLAQPVDSGVEQRFKSM